jgi:hypothetical protein
MQGVTVWHEDFAACAAGAELPQDGPWRLEAPAGAARRAATTVEAADGTRQLLLRGDGVVLTRSIYGRGRPAGPSGPLLRFSFELLFPGRVGQGQAFTIELGPEAGRYAKFELGPKASGALCGSRFRWRDEGSWHRIVIELDRVAASVRANVDGAPAASIPFAAAPGAADPRVLRLGVTGQLECRLRSVRVSAVPPAELYLAEGLVPGDAGGRSSLAALSAGQPLFLDQQVRWQRPPGPPAGRRFLQTGLNRQQPISYYSDTPGVLHAILWTWDFGFLGHLPPDEQGSVNGWTAGEAVPEAIRNAPRPFSSPRLYHREIGAGSGEIGLLEYFGQWVIVGFQPGAAGASSGPEPAACAVAGALTRHNVVGGGRKVAVAADRSPRRWHIWRNGVLVAAGEGGSVATPREPGRYVLGVDFGDRRRLEPLTVGFSDPPGLGWEEGFFPLHMYTGWGYTGLFDPNPPALKDLQTLAMFEMGANTFFLYKQDDLVDALGARSLLNIRAQTRQITRGAAGDTEAEEGFLEILRGLGPLPPGTIGLYVEDEPRLPQAARMSLLEEANRTRGSRLPLLYTLHGEDAVDFWHRADTTVLMTRAYPIRKASRGDLQGQISRELADYIVRCQQGGGGRPLWLVAQAFGDSGRPDLWDVPTPAQIRLMSGLALARGIRGLTFFCYDSSPAAKENLVGLARWPFVPEDARYAEVSAVFHDITAAGGFLAALHWEAAGESDSRVLDVQILRRGSGQSVAWVTNWDTTGAARGHVRLPAPGPTVAVDVPPGCGIVLDALSGEVVLRFGGDPRG